MNFNMLQLLVAWGAAALVAAILALSKTSPVIPFASVDDSDSIVLDAVRIGDGSAQRVAGELVTLLVDPADLPVSPEGEANGAMPFSAIEGAGAGPPVSAIMIEGGIPVVYIRGEEGLLAVTEGGVWNDWTVERIEPDRVFFSRPGQQFDFLAFAMVGNSGADQGAANAASERPAKKKREGKRKARE